jgi:hypothetical protein
MKMVDKERIAYEAKKAERELANDSGKGIDSDKSPAKSTDEIEAGKAHKLKGSARKMRDANRDA